MVEKKKIVLVVDDDDDIRFLVQKWLEKQDNKVISSVDGEE